MTLEKSKISEDPPAAPRSPCLTSKRIVLPLEMILYMAKFLKFADYRSFIQSLWPNKNDECDIVREELWKLSTYKCTTKFLNGKPVEVEYNFDFARIPEDRILINVHSLLPAIGFIVPPVMDKFVNITNLTNYVRAEVSLNMCSNFQHASCPCHLENVDEGLAADPPFVNPAVNTCEYGHFHHYCQEHVAQWIIFSLNVCILHRQVGDTLHENVVERYLRFLDNTVRFQGSEVRISRSLTIKPLWKPM